MIVAALLGQPAAAASYGGNCVLYARSVTGVALDGNAGAWWSNAAGRYRRGSEPEPGAVLVFKPGIHMQVGHVAVVSRVLSRREITVDQANWVRGRVVKNMSVIDASRDNDWTSVRVVELHSGTHGRENPTYGFIYPERAAPRAEDRLVATSDERALPLRLAAARIEKPLPAAGAAGKRRHADKTAQPAKPQTAAVRAVSDQRGFGRSRQRTKAIAASARQKPVHKSDRDPTKSAE